MTQWFVLKLLSRNLSHITSYNMVTTRQAGVYQVAHHALANTMPHVGV